VCRDEQQAVRSAINRYLLSPHRFYVNYLDDGYASLRRSLDTSLLIAFGVCEPDREGELLEVLTGLEGPFGPSVIQPGYAPADIGPAKHPPGRYHNEGAWPWISAYLALALARSGRMDRATEIVSRMLDPHMRTIHEWIDTLTGQRHHPDFATGAGALAWAITEGGLADWGESTAPGGNAAID
jgi:glycogen debranching enzyme